MSIRAPNTTQPSTGRTIPNITGLEKTETLNNRCLDIINAALAKKIIKENADIVKSVINNNTTNTRPAQEEIDLINLLNDSVRKATKSILQPTSAPVPAQNHTPVQTTNPTVRLASNNEANRNQLKGLPDAGGGSAYKIIDIEDAEGNIKPYLIWVTAEYTINGQTKSVYQPLKPEDNFESLGPIASTLSSQFPDKAIPEEFSISVNEKNDKKAQVTNHRGKSVTSKTYTVTMTDKKSKKTTTVDSNDSTLKAAVNTFGGTFHNVTRKLTWYDKDGKPINPAQESIVDGAKKKSKASGKGGKGDALQDAAGAHARFADAITDLGEPLLANHLVAGLNCMKDKLQSNIEINARPAKNATDRQGVQPWNTHDLMTQPLSKNRTRPVFIPIRTGEPVARSQSDTSATVNSDVTHYVYLYVTPDNTAVYYDPMGTKLFQNNILENDAYGKDNFGYNNLPGKLRNGKDGSDALREALASFCEQNNIQGIRSYQGPSHQNNGVDCGPCGLKWYERLNGQDSFLNQQQIMTVTTSDHQLFGTNPDIKKFREEFTDDANYPNAQDYPKPIAQTNKSQSPAPGTPLPGNNNLNNGISQPQSDPYKLAFTSVDAPRSLVNSLMGAQSKPYKIPNKAMTYKEIKDNYGQKIEGLTTSMHPPILLKAIRRYIDNNHPFEFNKVYQKDEIKKYLVKLRSTLNGDDKQIEEIKKEYIKLGGTEGCFNKNLNTLIQKIAKDPELLPAIVSDQIAPVYLSTEPKSDKKIAGTYLNNFKPFENYKMDRKIEFIKKLRKLLNRIAKNQNPPTINEIKLEIANGHHWYERDHGKFDKAFLEYFTTPATYGGGDIYYARDQIQLLIKQGGDDFLLDLLAPKP